MIYFKGIEVLSCGRRKRTFFVYLQRLRGFINGQNRNQDSFQYSPRKSITSTKHEWIWVISKASLEMLTQRLDDLFFWRIMDFGWRIMLSFSTLGLQKSKSYSVQQLKQLPGEVKNSPSFKFEKQTIERCNTEWYSSLQNIVINTIIIFFQTLFI